MSSALTLRPGLPQPPQRATIHLVAADPMTDGELIARVGEGDAGAFDFSTGATRTRLCARAPPPG